VYQGKNRYVRSSRDEHQVPDYKDLQGSRIHQPDKILPMYGGFDSNYDIETDDGLTTSIYSYY
jgi:hypothetical protein